MCKPQASPFREWETYHHMCLTTIMWREQIVEGKDRPAQMGAKKLSDLGKTVGIMLQMCEPIFGTGKAVVLESGFYVEKGITTLEERGVYYGALITKRKYWPKGVPGDEIDWNLHNRDSSDVDVLEAMTEEGQGGKAIRGFFQRT